MIIPLVFVGFLLFCSGPFCSGLLRHGPAGKPRLALSSCPCFCLLDFRSTLTCPANGKEINEEATRVDCWVQTRARFHSAVRSGLQPVVCAFHPSPQEAEAGRFLCVWDSPGLHSEFQDNQHRIVKPCLIHIYIYVCVCVCVCMFAYLCVWSLTSVLVNIYIYKYIDIHICTSACLCVCVWVYMCVHVWSLVLVWLKLRKCEQDGWMVPVSTSRYSSGNHWRKMGKEHPGTFCVAS